METEYEATFLNINKNEARRKLKKVGAELIKPEFLQKRRKKGVKYLFKKKKRDTSIFKEKIAAILNFKKPNPE